MGELYMAKDKVKVNNSNSKVYKEKSQDGRSFREKYRIYIYPVVLAWIVTMLVRPITADGPAMMPAVSDGEIIIVAKKTYSEKRGMPEFGQVVAFRKDFSEEGEKGDNTIRRVIGLPGDKIQITDGKVYRNDEILVEDYIIGDTLGEVEPFTVKDMEIFVLGDNREESLDSRDSEINTLKVNQLRGYCALRIWPINKLGRID